MFIYLIHYNMFHDKWVPVTMAWCILRLQMEEWTPIWKVAANILNKLSQTANNVLRKIYGPTQANDGA
jgi:hypothetical protein